MVTQLLQHQSADSAIHQLIAKELGVQAWQVKAAVELLDAGSTVPFIARYRKEATGTLDDTQLRTSKNASATCANWRIAGRQCSRRSQRKES